jgi:hypothetical protein
MSSEQQKETAFLKRCLRYDESAAGRQLGERIAQIQCNGRCLNRARWLVALLAALAVAGLGYAAVFRDSSPDQASVLTAQFVMNVVCAFCLGSLISLLAFTGLGLVYSRELNQLHMEARGLVTKLLESRFGEPHAANRNGHFKEQEVIALRGDTSVLTPESGNFSRAPGSR